jgi:hypothetical protein
VINNFFTVQNHQTVSFPFGDDAPFGDDMRAANALPAGWQSLFWQANYVKREIASGKMPSQ